MRDADYEREKLGAAARIIETTSDAYRTRKSTLSSIEKFNYEQAQKVVARALAPASQAKAVIEQFDRDIAESRARAEAARQARAAKKDGEQVAPAAGPEPATEKGGG